MTTPNPPGAVGASGSRAPGQPAAVSPAGPGVGVRATPGASGSAGGAGSAGGVAGASGTPPKASATRKPARPASTPAAPKRPKSVRPPRLASLQLRRIDPWTALKVSLIVSIVMFFVWMVAVGVLYLSLDALSVWDRINETYNTLIVAGDNTATQPDLITPGKVFGITAIVGAVNIVLFTALSAIAAFVYNAASGMAGGVELTLGERD